MAGLVHTRLKRMQCRPDLDGFIAETKLITTQPWRHPEPKTSMAFLGGNSIQITGEAFEDLV